MREKLKPCPACCGPASLRHNGDGFVCNDIKCRLVGPTDDPDGAKWNSLPRRTDASQGMSDGELVARAVLVDAYMRHGSSPRKIDFDLDAELDRRATARKESKP